MSCRTSLQRCSPPGAVLPRRKSKNSADVWAAASSEAESYGSSNGASWTLRGPCSALRVAARRKLQDRSALDALILQLLVGILPDPGIRPVACVEDLDLRDNSLGADDWSVLFNSLAEWDIRVQNVRLSGCLGLSEAGILFLVEWFAGLAVGKAPVELHLSNCEIVTADFNRIMDVVDRSSAFPHFDTVAQQFQPLVLRLQHNRIHYSVIATRLASGMAQICERRDGHVVPKFQTDRRAKVWLLDDDIHQQQVVPAPSTSRRKRSSSDAALAALDAPIAKPRRAILEPAMEMDKVIVMDLCSEDEADQEIDQDAFGETPKRPQGGVWEDRSRPRQAFDLSKLADQAFDLAKLADQGDSLLWSAIVKERLEAPVQKKLRRFLSAALQKVVKDGCTYCAEFVMRWTSETLSRWRASLSSQRLKGSEALTPYILARVIGSVCRSFSLDLQEPDLAVSELVHRAWAGDDPDDMTQWSQTQQQRQLKQAAGNRQLHQQQLEQLEQVLPERADANQKG